MKLSLPAASSARGPCHNCPAPRAGSSTPALQPWKSRQETINSLWALFGGQGGKMKSLGVSCPSLQSGCDVLTPLAHPEGCEAGTVQQYLPKTAPAIQDWHRAFWSSGERHHQNPECCSGQRGVGAWHPGLAQGSLSLLCSWPHAAQCPPLKTPA